MCEQDSKTMGHIRILLTIWHSNLWCDALIFKIRLVGDIPASKMGKINIVKELISQTNLQICTHSQSKFPQDIHFSTSQK